VNDTVATSRPRARVGETAAEREIGSRLDQGCGLVVLHVVLAHLRAVGRVLPELSQSGVDYSIRENSYLLARTRRSRSSRASGTSTPCLGWSRAPHQFGVDGVAGVAVVVLEVRVQGEAVAHGAQAGGARAVAGGTELPNCVRSLHRLTMYARVRPCGVIQSARPC
jgi:hypothetical protein